MFVLVLVPKTTAQRVPLGDAGGSPIAERLEVHKRDASPTHRQVVTLRRHRVPLHLLARIHGLAW